jgi:transcription initiation factor TFIID subunit 2
MLSTGWARINNTIDLKSANQPKPMPPPPVPIQAKPVIEPPKAPAKPAASTGVTAPTPTLKLKTVITVKPKGRKQKPVETARSPVVDDGSFDLLEEVIAIEKEKEKLVASKKQRQLTGGPEAVTPGKRKKDLLDELEDDEEILALASPSKKPSRSPQPSSTETDVRATSPGKFAGSIKIKRSSISVPEPAANQEVKPSVETSSKGKEREVASPAPTRPFAASETPINKAKAREVLKNLLKLSEAAIFSRPVDPVQDGCPTYLCLFVRVLVLSNAMLPTQIL